MPIRGHFFRRALLTRKVGQTDLVFGVPSGFVSIGLCAHDYKSLCAAVTICATTVDPKLDLQLHFDPVTSKSRPNRAGSISWCTHVRCTCGANFVTVGSHR